MKIKQLFILPVLAVIVSLAFANATYAQSSCADCLKTAKQDKYSCKNCNCKNCNCDSGCCDKNKGCTKLKSILKHFSGNCCG